MKFIKLLTSAYVGGVLRHPHEGVLHVTDDDASRLLDNEAATDVTADFPTSDDAPVEQITAVPGEAAITERPASEPHQAEVAPQKTETHKQHRKAAASKE